MKLLIPLPRPDRNQLTDNSRKQRTRDFSRGVAMRANKTEIAHLEISRSRFGIEASGGRVGPRSIHEFRGCRALAKAEKVAELKKKKRIPSDDPVCPIRSRHRACTTTTPRSRARKDILVTAICRPRIILFLSLFLLDVITNSLPTGVFPSSRVLARKIANAYAIETRDVVDIGRYMRGYMQSDRVLTNFSSGPGISH